MKITRDRHQGILKLDQGHYVQESLAKMNMNKETAHPTHSPIDSYESLKPSGPQDEGSTARHVYGPRSTTKGLLYVDLFPIPCNEKHCIRSYIKQKPA